MSRLRALALVLLLGLTGAEAHGFGHRGHRARACPPPPCVSYAAPALYAIPAPTYSAPAPLMAAPLASTAPAAAVVLAPVAPVAPSPYEYTANGQTTPAYFMTTDESGKPIPVQWMDWMFRGGKEAGMPRPPLPIVGRLRRD